MSEHGKLACHRAGGECVVERDGYYIMSAFCVILGGMLLMSFILPTVKRLQCGSILPGRCCVGAEQAALPMSAWRVKIPH